MENFTNNAPIGLGGAIIQTPGAIGYYDVQSPERQFELLEGASSLKSHKEVLEYVRSWVD
ncbi:MAG: hypothetical protein FWE29_04775 [Defluviitaleaceae bacterium]|nr:hypothetical protein [Defluviitaleaceae bacterium]